MSIATTPFASHIALRTLLKVSISCLLALSGGIFAFAEGGPIAAATIPIALGALLWNDIKGTFSLNVWMANGLGLIAFAIAGAEFFGESIEGRLLGFGHLLFYLSWILLWQEKGTSQIWWLCALSVLQVATSTDQQHLAGILSHHLCSVGFVDSVDLHASPRCSADDRNGFEGSIVSGPNPIAI